MSSATEVFESTAEIANTNTAITTVVSLNPRDDDLFIFITLLLCISTELN